MRILYEIALTNLAFQPMSFGWAAKLALLHKRLVLKQHSTAWRARMIDLFDRYAKNASMIE